MKVLLLYTYNKGLLSSFYQELSSLLVQDGCEVATVYLKNRQEYFVKNGVNYYGSKYKSLIKNYWFIFKQIRKIKPDIIVSNFGYINPALICGKLLGVKRNIAWFHTAFEHSKRHWFHVWFKTQCFKLSNLVITNSKSLSNEMTKYYGVSSNKLVEVPFWTNIIELEGKQDYHLNFPERGALKIGCPGRLVEDKNHKLVIEALFNLSSLHNNWKLYIAGNGPNETILKSYVVNKKLKDKVKFLGMLSSQEMKTFYKNMDLVILPSLHEAFGLVFIEAIALGTPVLVSKKFGALTFVDKNNFDIKEFVFNPQDVSELELKLKYFLSKNGKEDFDFQNLYKSTFCKETTYKKIKEVIFDL